jgi:hypothetical protein
VGGVGPTRARGEERDGPHGRERDGPEREEAWKGVRVFILQFFSFLNLFCNLNSNQNSNLILKEKHLKYFIVLIHILVGFVLKENIKGKVYYKTI